MDLCRFVPVSVDDIPEIAVLEEKSYLPGEPADEAQLKFRLEEAGPFFKQARSGEDNELVGFINGTCTNTVVMEEESMSKHVPGGECLCVHSVVIQPHLRRKGLASWMLQTYIRQVVRESPHVKRMALIVKEPLIPLYEGAGFYLVGKSSIVHGPDPWFEMRLKVTDALRELPVVQADAFSSKPFGGNPAAVVLLPPRAADYAPESKAGDDDAIARDSNPAEIAWMQNVALEMNLSETAFIRPCPNGVWDLRWFTPLVQIDLCGHATLASAHVMFSQGWVPKSQGTIVFKTNSGLVSASKIKVPSIGEAKAAEEPDEIVCLEFPSEAPAPVDDAERAELMPSITKGLGLPEAAIGYVGRNRMDAMVVVGYDSFKSIELDASALRGVKCRCVEVTSQPPAGEGSRPITYVTRVFAPLCGIDEDPVTGSAQCCMAPYWYKEAAGEDTEEDSAWMYAEQRSKRGGEIFTRIISGGKRVNLAGYCSTTMEGTLKGF